MDRTVHDVLAELQATMAVPKGRTNEFGGYAYRKAEDIILGARKSAPAGTLILCTDRIAEIGGQIFVIATASITYAGGTISTEAGAMHSLQKKGMDASQITGTASSYARKYALQGLFCLDDGKDDPDTKDNRHENGNDPLGDACARLRAAKTTDELRATWEGLPDSIRATDAAREAKSDRYFALNPKKEAA